MVIEMPPKGDRIVATHILNVLGETRKGLRFRGIKAEMAKKGWIHSDSSIIQNCHWLIDCGKIVKNGPIYIIKI